MLFERKSKSLKNEIKFGKIASISLLDHHRARTPLESGRECKVVDKAIQQHNGDGSKQDL